MAKSSYSTNVLPWMGAVLAVLLIAVAALLYLGGGRPDGSTGYPEFARLTAAAQAARERARGALAGDAEALELLARSRDEIAARWQALGQSPGARANLPTMSATGSDAGALVDSIERLLEFRESVMAVSGAADRITQVAPELLASTRNVLNALPLEDREFNQSYLEWLDQTTASIQLSLAGRGADRAFSETEQALRNGVSYLSEIVRGIIGQSDGLGIRPAAGIADAADLDATTRLLSEIQLAAQAIAEQGDSLAAAELAYAEVYASSNSIVDQFGTAAGAGPAPQSNLPLIFLLMALLVVVAMTLVFLRARDVGRSADVHAEQNERNQQAILRLLDELSNLADGDLTVQATVTEDITGAIADSINYAIEALRELVVTINDSSILVDAAAKQSEATAHHLVRASETQAKQAISASSSITHMAASVAEVSGNAERGLDVARHAVDVSHKGGDAVRRTIEGMNAIRETIQDTSKRIKRLGESSQEIGNIVELIEEIAEQTNILALNASIEASRAGEASRGFAVVADEVQKLAERSTAATRKIEVLVSTIQSDTNEAIVSMERSTTDVVGGALLAENAGAALDEIEQVSHQIASLVQNISGSAREQTGVASAISRNMDVLKDVSAQAKRSATAASSSISKLSELATQLRGTVSGFALPDKRSETAAMSKAQVGDGLARDRSLEGYASADGAAAPDAPAQPQNVNVVAEGR